jgi:hypothetical protein
MMARENMVVVRVNSEIDEPFSPPSPHSDHFRKRENYPSVKKYPSAKIITPVQK